YTTETLVPRVALAALYPPQLADLCLLCAFPNGASDHGREGGGHTRQVQERRHVHRHSWSQSHWPAGGHRGDGHGCAHPRESASLRGALRRTRVQQWERGSVFL